MLWFDTQQQIPFEGFAHLLTKYNDSAAEFSTASAHAYQIEQHNLQLDSFNNIYVALTRPVQGVVYHLISTQT